MINFLHNLDAAQDTLHTHGGVLVTAHKQWVYFQTTTEYLESAFSERDIEYYKDMLSLDNVAVEQEELV